MTAPPSSRAAKHTEHVYKRVPAFKAADLPPALNIYGVHEDGRMYVLAESMDPRLVLNAPALLAECERLREALQRIELLAAEGNGSRMGRIVDLARTALAQEAK